MPGKARKTVVGALHHVVSRGIKGKPIFKTDYDMTEKGILGSLKATYQILDIYFLKTTAVFFEITSPSVSNMLSDGETLVKKMH